MLRVVKSELHLPIVTDIHQPEQAALVAEVMTLSKFQPLCRNRFTQ